MAAARPRETTMKTSKLAHSFVSSVMLLALGALGAGCVVEADEALLDEEDDVGEAEEEIGLVNDAAVVSLPQVGGNGGNAYADTLCPAGLSETEVPGKAII